MRMRALLRALTLALACGSAGFGCQIVAGLTVLQITGGSGGGGGTGTTGSGEMVCDGEGPCKPPKGDGNSCSTDEECGSTHCTDGVCCKVSTCLDGCWSCAVSSDGTCQPKTNSLCGSSVDDACTDPDTCDAQGICQPRHATVGTSCGQMVATECSAPDTCDGSGSCKPNDMPIKTKCGSAIDDACTDPDSCDGLGVCQSRDATQGTACGGTCALDIAVAVGTCNGTGACSSSTPMKCPANYGCAADGKSCATTCTATTGCSATGFCITPAVPPTCTGCGSMPGMPSCPGSGGSCETCAVGGTCVKTCDATNECNGPASPPIQADAGMGPVRILCGSQCNGLSINCMGPFGCEIVCDNGGCNSLTILCSADGPCKLTCTGTSCPAVAMKCGDNECSASCSGASSVVTQACNGSCGCTKQGCL